MTDTPAGTSSGGGGSHSRPTFFSTTPAETPVYVPVPNPAKAYIIPLADVQSSASEPAEPEPDQDDAPEATGGSGSTGGSGGSGGVQTVNPYPAHLTGPVEPLSSDSAAQQVTVERGQKWYERLLGVGGGGKISSNPVAVQYGGEGVEVSELRGQGSWIRDVLDILGNFLQSIIGSLFSEDDGLIRSVKVQG